MRVIAIYGGPGTGKTTTATALVYALGAHYVSSGDIARAVDPEALARGEMANREKLREGFRQALYNAGSHGITVVDGLPRDPTDVELLPEGTIYIFLTCTRSIAVERQVARGRKGDEDISLIWKRTDEQAKLLQLSRPNSWAYRLATEQGTLSTSYLRPDQVNERVLDYISGRRDRLI